MILRLKEIRISKGLNMRQTAKALGIPYTTYISYEQGKREPRLEFLVLLTKFFDCSADYLLGLNQKKGA